MNSVKVLEVVQAKLHSLVLLGYQLWSLCTVVTGVALSSNLISSAVLVFPDIERRVFALLVL